jgi:D-3-phosphoglycerate dehydrogenase
MKKIFISDKLANDGVNYLKEQTDIEIHFEVGLTEDQLCEKIGDFDALLIRSDTVVTPKFLQAAKNLKLIGRAGIGVDNVDIPAATEMGVIVMNTPDANATTTAELAIAHMMSLSRHLPAADKSVREGKWERSKLMGTEIAQKTLGIVGFGTIGRLVSQRAAGLRMKVIAFDPFVAPEIYADLGVESVTLDDLISHSDYITLHCPLIEKTKNIIGKAQLEKMKNSAMLINCARGGLIDEAALYDALKNKQIAGAALDVFDIEPPKDSPLLELDNIVFTPHLGASTNEAQLAVSVEIAKQAVTFLRTGEAVNALNLPRVSADELKKSNDYMNLATQLGKVLAGLSLQPLTKLEVSLFGRAADVLPRPISVAALIGVLSGQVSTPVNRVNAENIAKRQGLALVESVSSQEMQDYVSLIKLTGYSADNSITLSGVLLGGRLPRLVSINDMNIEVIPEGTLLITRHDDKPGVISAISSVLGNAAINISRMQVGTADNQAHAMAVISISQPLSADLLEQVGAIEAVNQVAQIAL